MRISASVFERPQRLLSRELRAANREAQPVTGHRIDKARRVAGQQQPGHPGGRAINRQRSQHDRWRDTPRVDESIRQRRFTANRFRKQRKRIPQQRAIRGGDTEIRQAAGQLGDADVFALPDVHLAEETSVVDVGEIRTNCPAARPVGESSEPEVAGDA